MFTAMKHEVIKVRVMFTSRVHRVGKSDIITMSQVITSCSKSGQSREWRMKVHARTKFMGVVYYHVPSSNQNINNRYMTVSYNIEVNHGCHENKY